MMDALEMLVSNARQLIASGYYDVPPVNRRGRTERSLLKAIMEHPTFPIIAEVKLASPGKPSISHHRPGDLVRCYRQGGAAALSVLTEPNHFQGSLELLEQASATGAPCLMKDIVVAMNQIEAGANKGACAVLLIERLALGPGRLDIDHLIEGAHALGLDVLLEVSSDEEMRRALAREADIIGINQRDLGSMDICASKGSQLLDRYGESAHVPIIVMSGIERAEQIVELRDKGASGVLVGTALSSSPDPEAKLRSLGVSR